MERQRSIEWKREILCGGSLSMPICPLFLCLMWKYLTHSKNGPCTFVFFFLLFSCLSEKGIVLESSLIHLERENTGTQREGLACNLRWAWLEPAWKNKINWVQVDLGSGRAHFWAQNIMPKLEFVLGPNSVHRNPSLAQNSEFEPHLYVMIFILQKILKISFWA